MCQFQVDAQTTTLDFATQCVLHEWVGDTFCDDNTNNVDCNFDGGDCCGPNVTTNYCTPFQLKCTVKFSS